MTHFLLLWGVHARPLAHGGSQRYWFWKNERRTVLLLRNLNTEQGTKSLEWQPVVLTTTTWPPLLLNWNTTRFNRIWDIIKWWICPFNPLTAVAAYIRVFIFISTLSTTFKHVKDKRWHKPEIFKNSYPPFCQIWIIFTHFKLWIASARHNFKWVKIQIE